MLIGWYSGSTGKRTANVLEYFDAPLLAVPVCATNSHSWLVPCTPPVALWTWTYLPQRLPAVHQSPDGLHQAKLRPLFCCPDLEVWRGPRQMGISGSTIQLGEPCPFCWRQHGTHRHCHPSTRQEELQTTHRLPRRSHLQSIAGLMGDRGLRIRQAERQVGSTDEKTNFPGWMGRYETSW